MHDDVTITVSAEPDSASLRAWDELVASNPAGDAAQLSVWAALRKEAGFNAVRILARRGQEVSGGAQVLCRRLPIGGMIGYVSYGPLVDAGCPDRAVVLREVCDALEGFGRRRLRMLFVQPAEGCEDVSQELLRRGFRGSDAGIAPAASLRIDLSGTVDELRLGLSKRLRTWTNRWPARGVSVRLADAADLPVVAALLADTARHQGFAAFSERYLHTVHHELVRAGHAAIFVGEVDGRAVATDVMTVCGGAVKVRFVGMDRSSPAAALNVPGAIRWESIKWAKANGHRWFDFGGLRPASVGVLTSGSAVDVEELAGPDRYKVRFGGSAYHYPPAVELVPSLVVRGAYDLVRGSTRGRRLLDTAKLRVRGGHGVVAGRR